MIILNIILFLILIVLQVLDVYTTNKILSQGGRELNKIMKFFMDKFKSFWYIPKVLIVLCSVMFLLFLPILYMSIVLGLINCFYIYVVFHNFKEIK